MPETLLPIRQIAAAPGGALVALGGFGVVEIWDAEHCVRTAQLRTILDFGGTRLAIAPDGEHLFAARFSGGDAGVAAYRLPAGDVRWHRTDLARVQQILIAPDGRELYCCLEEGPCEVLDPLDGNTQQRLRDVRSIFRASDPPLLLMGGRRSRVTTVDGSRLFAVKRERFAFLAAAFSPTLLCTSESGGSVRTFALQSGTPCWRYDPPAGNHVLDLAYDPRIGAFFGVQWPFQAGGDKVLLWLSERTGEAAVVRSLGQPAEARVVGHLGLVICSSRATYRLDDGSPGPHLGSPARSSVDGRDDA